MKLNGKINNKNRIFTTSIREIKNSFPRFLSLLIMSLLGVFCFSGLQATSPDMIKSLDTYLDNADFYDFKIISAMGLEDADIKTLENIDGVNKVCGAYSKDLLLTDGDNEFVSKILSITDGINELELVDGRMPGSANEIVVEQNLIKNTGYKIGDSIPVKDINIASDKLTIVGTVVSPLYFNCNDIKNDRGNTSVGTGTINFYMYGTSELFNFGNYYTEIYLTCNDAKDMLIDSNEYNDLIENNKDKIEEIKKTGWYIYDRKDMSTYSDYIDDSDSINNLSKIFPVVFFAVAILISLISMNRMVEDHRSQIGTLKSLGFNNARIIYKYLMFSTIAVIAGGVIGALLGVVIIPSLIWNIYQILFVLPEFYLGLNIKTSLVGFLISFVCICGTTVFTVNKVIKEKPAELLRPRAPKSGKRVFLENIRFIWSRIKFSNKIIVRNIFRYKKRVIVTVGGIIGCTALMLCGFGLRDSIVDLPTKQYEELYTYDDTVYVKPGSTDEELSSVFSQDEIEDYVNVEMLKGTTKDYEINMFIPEDDSKLSSIINLNDLETGEKLNLAKGKVIITDKLAQLLDVGIGDKIEIVDIDNNTYEFEIAAVAENYLSHYIYISKETFGSAGGKYVNNVSFLNTKDLSDKEQENLSKKLLESNSILNVTSISSFIESAENMLVSLNNVVLILIVLASMLSFVVLYNLSNININERQREIATLKVLGFYDKEVDNYITKENIILTIIGVILGLLVGIFLTNIVIATVEIEYVRFIHKISVYSYVFSAAIAVIFTYIVNFITHFTLKKIDMIESLKSVE